MAEVLLRIPAPLADALQVPSAEQPARLQRELAVRLYQKGLLTFGKARQLSGTGHWEFHELRASEGTTRSYDHEELECDLATLERLT